MNSRFLNEYINYVRSSNGKNIPLVWTCPGLVFGFNYSILDFIDSLRQTLKHDKVYLVAYTWEVSFNMPFVNALYRLTHPVTGKYKNIELILITEPYEESSIIELSQRLLQDLNITKSGYKEENLLFSNMHFKKMVYFYSHYRTFKYIYTRFDNEKGDRLFPLVFRLSPKLYMADRRWVHSSGLNTILHLFEYAQKHLSVEDLDAVKHPYDILYTVDSGSSYYDDMFYASSPETLVNIFGNSDEGFYQKMLSFYKKYIYKYPGIMETDLDFNIFGKNRSHIPLEGSTIMKEFADNSHNKVVNVSCRFLASALDSIIPVKNPWYGLSGSKLVPDENLKKDKLLLGYLQHDKFARKFITFKRKDNAAI